MTEHRHRCSCNSLFQRHGAGTNLSKNEQNILKRKELSVSVGMAQIQMWMVLDLL